MVPFVFDVEAGFADNEPAVVLNDIVLVDQSGAVGQFGVKVGIWVVALVVM